MSDDQKRPSLQWYPSDWRDNAKLRRCSPAARGVWMDIICLFHDAPDGEYGVLRWPLKDIANAAGASMAHVRELVDKGVLKGAEKGMAPYVFTPMHAGRKGTPSELVTAADGPCWYSSRMVRDEWLRQRRGAASRFTPENQPKRGPKPSGGEGPQGAPMPPPNPPPMVSPKGGFGERQGERQTEPMPPPKPGMGERQGDGLSSSSSLIQKRECVLHPPAHEDGDDPAARFEAEAHASGFTPSPAGLICRAMKAKGMADTNPSHPTLQALLSAGAEVGEFEAAAEKAVRKRQGFGYALSIVVGERKNAAQVAQSLHLGPLPNAAAPPSPPRDHAQAQQWLAEQDERTRAATSPEGRAAARQAMAALGAKLAADRLPH